MTEVGFQKLNAEEIEKSLSQGFVCLAGNIERPIELEEIKTEDVEISLYKKQPQQGKAHYHVKQTEYVYMLEGKTEFLEIKTGVIHVFGRGDFFCISPMTQYREIILEPVKIIVIKIPAKNDKIVLEEKND